MCPMFDFPSLLKIPTRYSVSALLNGWHKDCSQRKVDSTFYISNTHPLVWKEKNELKYLCIWNNNEKDCFKPTLVSTYIYHIKTPTMLQLLFAWPRSAFQTSILLHPPLALISIFKAIIWKTNACIHIHTQRHSNTHWYSVGSRPEPTPYWLNKWLNFSEKKISSSIP